eukprot:sb/3471631/
MAVTPKTLGVTSAISTAEPKPLDLKLSNELEDTLRKFDIFEPENELNERINVLLQLDALAKAWIKEVSLEKNLRYNRVLVLAMLFVLLMFAPFVLVGNAGNETVAAVFQWIFLIILGIQGVVVFIVQVVLNDEVRKSWATVYTGSQLQRSLRSFSDSIRVSMNYFRSTVTIQYLIHYREF